MTSDVARAIEDFEFAVKWVQKTRYDASFIESRTPWIAARRAGQDPAVIFDTARLEQLR